MKTKIVMLLLLLSNYGFSQSGEFEVYQNGLIYSENSVNKLKRIVDSLNLKFKVCEYKKTFKATSQNKAHHISLEKYKILQAKSDLDKGISFEDFMAKYPKAISDKNLLVTKFKYYDEYDKKDLIVVDAVEFKRGGNQSISKSVVETNHFFDTSIKGKWYYDYNKKTEYSEESLDAFYFIENFESNLIPLKYAKSIQYSECIVDTTAEVFSKEANDSGRGYYDTLPRKFKEFNSYVEKVLNRPDFDDEKYDVLSGMDTLNYEKPWKKKKMSKKERLKSDERRKQVEVEYEVFSTKLNTWEALRLTRLDSLKNNDSRFMLMLNEAYNESKVVKSSDDQFEEYVGMYISKDAELVMKRNRRVIGGCSMDMSPRIHAFNIAILSAETTKWEIFLRSHLNIMNDRFERVSDGSYAQEARKTYIKELETLDINVLDLIVGISLRVENPSQNHYYSSINRIGRALSESKNKSELETLLLTMIKDHELDDYNRVLMYYLFENYNYYIEDVALKALNKERLKMAVAEMPNYINSRIEIK
jgi:hypothetical protein